MKIVTLTKKNTILKGEIDLPASKSISNRALIINHLIEGQLQLQNLSGADDTQLMIKLLETISNTKSSKFPTTLNCENAGTVLRFLTALLAITPGNWIITGSERMKERPIGILVDTLVELGAEINYLGKAGFPPLEVKGKRLQGGNINIDGSISSQFISALLLIAPYLENGLFLTLTNKIGSRPYIEMTLGILNYFGINYTFEGNKIHVQQQDYKAKELRIESDWSAAAFWYEMVAFADEADIVLKDLYPKYPSTLTLNSSLTENRYSLQGDAILPEIYKSFAVKTEFLDHGIRLTKKGKSVSEIKLDFTNYPDLAQSVIVTCAGLGIKGAFTGLKSLRLKETDRLKALQIELQKWGIKTNIIRSSGFEVRSYIPDSIKNQKSKIVHTYGDHRMAMAFAPLAMVFEHVQIEDPDVVSKSYPNFWRDLNKVDILTSFCK